MGRGSLTKQPIGNFSRKLYKHKRKRKQVGVIKHIHTITDYGTINAVKTNSAYGKLACFGIYLSTAGS